MEPLSAEEALDAVQAVLRARGVVRGEPWRNDITATDDGAWTVRTWTGADTPGPPDHVHRVSPAPGGAAPRVERVFPVRAPRRARASRKLDHSAPGTLHEPPPWPAREDLPPRSD
ncbi:hypothetical protein AB1207_06075 [Kineococcus endophyticus]|uniref:Uncharacterized protein n=1 Tax=Kineococcus endophyticus TaxID=1181883 RepID=A0ABV3P3V4_9ACTN